MAAATTKARGISYIGNLNTNKRLNSSQKNHRHT